MSDQTPPTKEMNPAPGAPAEPPKTCDFSRYSRGFAVAAWAGVPLNALAHEDPTLQIIIGVLALGSAVLGIVSGVLGLRKIKASGGTLVGWPSAIGGIIASGAYILVVAFVAFAVFSAAPRIREESRRVISASHLSVIGKATSFWCLRKGNESEYPRSLKALVDDGVVTPEGRRIFLCPGSGSTAEPGRFVCDYESTLERAGFTITEAMEPSNHPLAWEKRPFFSGCKDNNLDGPRVPGRNVVFFDHHVEWYTEEEFQQLLKDLDQWLARHRPRPGP